MEITPASVGPGPSVDAAPGSSEGEQLHITVTHFVQSWRTGGVHASSCKIFTARCDARRIHCSSSQLSGGCVHCKVNKSVSYCNATMRRWREEGGGSGAEWVCASRAES